MTLVLHVCEGRKTSPCDVIGDVGPAPEFTTWEEFLGGLFISSFVCMFVYICHPFGNSLVVCFVIDMERLEVK